MNAEYLHSDKWSITEDVAIVLAWRNDKSLRYELECPVWVFLDGFKFRLELVFYRGSYVWTVFPHRPDESTNKR